TDTDLTTSLLCLHRLMRTEQYKTDRRHQTDGREYVSEISDYHFHRPICPVVYAGYMDWTHSLPPPQRQRSTDAEDQHKPCDTKHNQAEILHQGVITAIIRSLWDDRLRFSIFYGISAVRGWDTGYFHTLRSTEGRVHGLPALHPYAKLSRRRQAIAFRGLCSGSIQANRQFFKAV